MELMGRITTSYFKTQIEVKKLFIYHAGNAETTLKKLTDAGVKYSIRSLYRMKTNATKTFSINQTKISITKISML